MTRSGLRLTLAMAPALLLITAGAFAQRPETNLTGAWNAETDSGGGKTESKLLLKMEGEKLTGTLKTSYGDFPLQDGNVDGPEPA